MLDLIVFQQKPGLPKYKWIVNTVLKAIETGKITVGDQLPSSAQLTEMFGVARDTVIKAINELKSLGIIESHPGKGYYISSVTKVRERNIFLLFDSLNPFKEQLYNSLLSNIGSKANTDIFFHHQNQKVFKQIIEQNAGQFTDYIIMPTTEPGTIEILDSLQNAGNVYLLDVGLKEFSAQFSGIYQDFEKGIYKALFRGLKQIQKYSKFNLVINVHPIPSSKAICSQITRGFSMFCAINFIDAEMYSDITVRNVNKGECYFVHEDHDLEKIVLIAREKELELGTDIGVISFNDTPLKNVVANGITTISVDFKKYGTMLADMILNKKAEAMVNETKLILRHSL